MCIRDFNDWNAIPYIMLQFKHTLIVSHLCISKETMLFRKHLCVMRYILKVGLSVNTTVAKFHIIIIFFFFFLIFIVKNNACTKRKKKQQKKLSSMVNIISLSALSFCIDLSNNTTFNNVSSVCFSCF